MIAGGSGYTTAPTCTIAGPSNNSPYLSPTGSTLWAGGTQAACTTTVNSGTATAVWTVAIQSTTAVGDQIIVGSQTYTLSGASTTAIATALKNAINANNTVATATSSTKTVTITAKTAGAAGNFNVSFGTATLFDAFYVYITNTTKGQGQLGARHHYHDGGLWLPAGDSDHADWRRRHGRNRGGKYQPRNRLILLSTRIRRRAGI